MRPSGPSLQPVGETARAWPQLGQASSDVSLARTAGKGRPQSRHWVRILIRLDGNSRSDTQIGARDLADEGADPQHVENAGGRLVRALAGAVEGHDRESERDREAPQQAE